MSTALPLGGAQQTDWDALCALSLQMDPLRSANDIGVLMQAMRQFPQGLPDRVSFIAAQMPAYSEQQIARLLARLEVVGVDFVETSNRLADTGLQVHLLPHPTCCVVCGEPGLVVDRTQSGVVRPPSSPTVISERGILQGILHSKTCRKCGALHGMSYASGGSELPSGKQMPYAGATARESRWCQLSPKVVWENSLLHDFEAQAVFSHTGYSTFADEYEWKHGGDSSSFLRRSLAHSWLAWSLLRWSEELGMPVAPLGLTTDEERERQPEPEPEPEPENPNPTLTRSWMPLFLRPCTRRKAWSSGLSTSGAACTRWSAARRRKGTSGACATSSTGT